MCYDIYIGEQVTISNDDYGPSYDRVKGTTASDAPVFRGDEMTGNGSSRHPSYSGWSDFVRKVGLHDLFFNVSSGLMRLYPGCIKLQPKHAYVIGEALIKYKAEHPNAKPGWCLCSKCSGFMKPDELQHEDLDGDLARLEWLYFWVVRALGTCKVPAIYNN
jgi:hypothetical protein